MEDVMQEAMRPPPFKLPRDPAIRRRKQLAKYTARREALIDAVIGRERQCACCHRVKLESRQWVVIPQSSIHCALVGGDYAWRHGYFGVCKACVMRHFPTIWHWKNNGK